MNNQNITKRLTATYIVALVLVGAMAIAADLFLVSSINENRDTGTVINMAGRQRMLSQRVSLSANLFIQFGSDETRQNLRAIATDMLDDHEALVSGDMSRGIMTPPSEDMRTYYFDAPHELDRRVRDFIANARRLADIPDSRSVAAVALAREINEEARNPLLKSLDAAVLGYETEAAAKVTFDTRLSNVLVLIQLVMLVAVGAIIFRPMVRRIGQDLEDRRAREKQLERMSWVVENMDDAMILTNQDGQIIACNRAAESLTGYDRDELLGKPVIDLAVHETLQSRTDMRAEARQALVGGGVWRGEFEIVRKDGQYRVFDNRTTALRDDTGDIIGRISINRDITDRYEVDRMKNEFISVVSHELRTPLTSIMGSLGIVQSGAVGEINDEVKEMLGIAHNNSDRLVRLINDILDIEKIEAGRMDFTIERLSVAALIEQALEDNEGYASRSGVPLAATMPDDDAWVRADRDKVRQVFANLISNAVKFSPENAPVELGIDTTDTMVRFSVTDSGPGIPEDYHGKVFEKFSQADSSATRKAGGTGLGLTITKAIVERLGGDIWFDTKAGEGTTFTFTLPRTESTKPILAPKTSGRRALVVEDDPDMATLLRTVLQQTHVAADITSTVDDAKRQLDNVDYDLVTLDLDVAGESGLQLLYDLRMAGKTTPVVIVSGHVTGDMDSIAGGAIDMAGWLRKPLDPSLLKSVVGKALNGGSSAPRVLHVEDDADVIKVVGHVLNGHAQVTAVSTLEDARKSLSDSSIKYDLILLDLMLPDGRGEDLLADLRSNGASAIPVVVFSAHEMQANDVARSVTTVLQKSRTPNDDLLQCIVGALERGDSTAPALNR